MGKAITGPGGGDDRPAGYDPSVPDVADLVGEFADLEVLELLGRGGMGACTRARQTSLDRVVAVKLFPRDLARDPSFEQRFHHEARVLASLNHPNVVAAHGFGQSPRFYYLVMEYVPGPSLRDVLRCEAAAGRVAVRIAAPGVRRWPTPTRPASCTATSSRRTCCCTPAAAARCRTCTRSSRRAAASASPTSASRARRPLGGWTSRSRRPTSARHAVLHGPRAARPAARGRRAGRPVRPGRRALRDDHRRAPARPLPRAVPRGRHRPAARPGHLPLPRARPRAPPRRRGRPAAAVGTVRHAWRPAAAADRAVRDARRATGSRVAILAVVFALSAGVLLVGMFGLVRRALPSPGRWAWPRRSRRCRGRRHAADGRGAPGTGFAGRPPTSAARPATRSRR